MTIDQAFQLAYEHHQAGRLPQAEEIYRQIVAGQPDHFNSVHLLGALAFQAGRYEAAAELLRRAMALNPAAAAPYYHFGCVLQARNQFSEAIAFYRLAIARKEGFAEAWNNLGNAHKELGEIAEAIAALRTAVKNNPANMSMQSNLLLTLWFDSHMTIDAVAEEHFRWNNTYARALASDAEFANERSPDRRLRVGYVSPDFRQHPVTAFFEPLLANHDHGRIEVFCYSHPLRVDEITARFRGYADHWREISAMSDEQAAALIREDRIDLLVDLAGHTAGNRLGVFARKSAPVQVSYLGYIGTTGMSAIDYRLADAHTDPVGKADRWYAEKIVYLPRTFACYRPPEDAPPVGSLPAAKNGYVNFASLNALGKVTTEMLELWASILHATPNSHLLMTAIGLQDDAAKKKIRRFFEVRGIAADRLELLGFMPQSQYMELHKRIDILLDTYPVNGHTITSNALWMGVPVVSWAGESYVSRLGASVLKNLSLDELVASAANDYVKKATTLAGSLPRLAELRATLRERMRASPVMDAARNAREVEGAYRQMWQAWCAG